MVETKLPVTEIIYKSFYIIKKNYINIIKLGIPYIIVALILNIYSFYYIDFKNDSIDMSYFILIIPSLFLFILFSTKLHRLFILNEYIDKINIYWTSRENRFLGRYLIIFLCVFLAIIPIVIVSILFLYPTNGYEQKELKFYSFLLMFFMYYFISRFSLVLPSTAIDKKENSLKWSWKLSKGNSLRLFLLLGILPMLHPILFSFLPRSENIIYSLSSIITTILILPYEICFLSLSYIFLVKLNNFENK